MKIILFTVTAIRQQGKDGESFSATRLRFLMFVKGDFLSKLQMVVPPSPQ